MFYISKVLLSLNIKIKQIEIMTTITFGKGKEKVNHVIETSKVNEYLISLANAGWDLSEITKITKK